MVSFLGLMDTVKLKPKVNHTGEVTMTQYMLKMLTILTNILVSNMVALDSKNSKLDVIAYIGSIVSSLT